MANENVTRVTVDATGYTAGLDKASRSAQAFAESNEAASRRIAAAQQAVQEAAVNGSNASVSKITQFINSLSRQADQAGKTRTELLRMQAAQLGVSDAAEASIAKIEAVAEASRHAGEGAESFSLKSAGARRELLVMAHEASQGNWKNLAGSFQVFAERTDLLSKAMSPLGLTLGVVAGAAALVGYQILSGAAAFDALSKSSNLTNGYLGLTDSQLKSISLNLGGSSTSIKTVEAAMTALVNSGQVAGDTLSLATKVTVDFAHDSGEAVEKVAESLVKFAQDPQKALVELQSQYHTFSAAQVEVIENYIKAGDKAAAYKAILSGMDQAHDQFKANAETNVGYVGRLWAGLKGIVVDVGNAIANVGVGASHQEALDELLAKQAALQNGMSHMTAVVGGRQVDNASAQKQLDILKGQVAAAQALVDADNKRALAASTRAKSGDAQVSLDTYNNDAKYASPSDKLKIDVDTENKHFTDLANTYKEARAALIANTPYDTKSLDSLAGSYESAVKRHNDNIKQINDAYQKSLHKGGAENGLNADLAGLQGQLKLREDALKTSLAHVKSLLDRGLIDTGTALQSESDQRQAAYADELALVLKQEDLAKGKKQLKALVDYQTQEKLIRQKMLDDQKQTIDSQEKLMESNMSKVAAYQDALANKLSTARNASDISVSALGTGSQETDQASRLNALQRDYDQQYASLQKSMQEHPQDAAVYKNELDALNSYQEARVALELSTNDRLAAARADWGNGWNRALQNYQDEVADKATQTANIFNDATKGMEDVWVQFATTGRLSFSSLTTSVIADIARIQARAAIAAAASGLSGFLGTLFSIGASAATSALTGTGATLDGLTGSAASSAYTQSGGGGNTYGFTAKAEGGAIVGPGTGTSDSIIARLSNGEGVLTADAMRRLGVPALNALNNGASINGLAKFATGGAVGSAMTSVSGGSASGGTIQMGDINVQGGDSSTDNKQSTKMSRQLDKAIRATIQEEIVKANQQGGTQWRVSQGLRI